MFDKDLLNEYLAEYCKYLSSYGWKEVKYKWQAITDFRRSFDIMSFDLAGMLAKALEKARPIFCPNTVTGRNWLTEMARTAPDDVRTMFSTLFNESKDVYRRIKDFSSFSGVILEKMGMRRRLHIQSEYLISSLLWLKYPDKYYQYSFGDIKWLMRNLQAGDLSIDYDFDRIMPDANALYDEIREEISHDTGLLNLVRERIDIECYSDPKLMTLTSDFCSFIARKYPENDMSADSKWFPCGYEPEMKMVDWARVLKDKDICSDEHLEILARLHDYGGCASVDDLAKNYGKTKHYYNTGITAFAANVAKAHDLGAALPDDEFLSLFSIPFTWRYSFEFDEKNLYFKLRPELDAALSELDLSHIELYSDVAPRDRIKNFWLLNTNPRVWGFSHIAVGEVKAYSLYNDNGYKRRIFDNLLSAKAGDIVIGYESYPSNQIVGLGVVSAPHDDKYIYFQKTEGLASPIDLQMLMNNPELNKMEFFKNMQGNFFHVNQGEYDRIMDMVREENPLRNEEDLPSYTKKDFLDEVYLSSKEYDILTEVLKTKKNLILEGAPGVGKTFTAKRLAYSMMGVIDDSRVEFVQFHQNYTYEDFVLGYRPTIGGQELKYGIFYRFCLYAGNHPDKSHFFIIDEINRGNMSRIFGELLMMIEKDYRGTVTTLSYNGLRFRVPENLYIIGMMNTADRSIALIDYALRRRFSFYLCEPRFETEGFKKYRMSLNNREFDAVIDEVIKLNKAIETDPKLGKGYCIGHSYFCGKEKITHDWLKAVVDYEVIPMLREYWFDEPQKISEWTDKLHSVIGE